MKWQPWGPYAIRSDSFAISKASVKGTWYYTLWHNGKIIDHGRPFTSAADAKRRAVEILGAGDPGPAGGELGGTGRDRVGADAGG